MLTGSLFFTCLFMNSTGGGGVELYKFFRSSFLVNHLFLKALIEGLLHAQHCATAGLQISTSHHPSSQFPSLNDLVEIHPWLTLPGQI